MSPELLKVAAGVLGVGAVTLALIVAGEWLARRKVERWARSQGFQLLEFTGVPFWRGPRAWRRTENQEDYQVLVQDASGRRRRGWLLYTSPWHSLGPQHVEVTWDESS